MYKKNDSLKIQFLLITLIVGSFSACSTKDGNQPPNIVLIMADDVGTEVLGCYGGSSYDTPNLDHLAKTGVKFTNCYSTPKCSPSRVKIMTGRYQFRTTEKWGHIPPDEITFGHVLKSSGYATALAGKWQMILLGENPDHIRKMGFDENCVFGWHEGPRYHDPYIWQNGKILQNTKGKYGPDIYCDFLIKFIQKNKDKPFLVYYPMTTAHDISDDLTSPPPTAPDGKYQSYKDLIEEMDRQIGRLISAIDNLGLREKTLILFTTDNGTPKKFITRFSDGKYLEEPVYSEINGEMVLGGKGDLTDAGTHVPLIANWTGTTQSGTICEDLIDFSDFMPTLAELAQAKRPGGVIIDGKSFAPQILGQSGEPRDWIFNQYEGDAWLRTKKWKLYRSGHLFDMYSDPLEQNPLPQESGSTQAGSMRDLSDHWREFRRISRKFN
jgi:arylsulfatase A-like enzyme